MKSGDPRAFGDAGGFTLVELLVVLVVIAVLAAIALPNFTGAKEGAGKAKDFHDRNAAMNNDAMTGDPLDNRRP